MPRKVFVAGEILTASDVNTNLMDQSVMVFDDDTARTTAIPTPVEGMVTYLKDANQVQAFTGSAFTAVGGILQVVSTAKTDTFTSASTTFVTITDLSATITPTATTSKILVIAQISVSGVTDSGHAFKLSGGNTNNYVGDSPSARIPAVFGGFISNADLLAYQTSHSIVFLDSPTTTSSTTYEVQARGTAISPTVTVNRAQSDVDNANRVRGVSSITLMEVAG